MKNFFSFEGIDGSGKTTIASHVYNKLKENHYKVILTAEPTDTPIGRYVHQCITTDSDPFVTAFTFIADRIQHSKQIQTWISEGLIVLCDRYAESTYAYQGAQLEHHIDDPVRWLQDLSKSRIIIPDRTFVFNVDPVVSLQRIQHRKELIPFEHLEFLKKVHAKYLSLCQGQRFCILDATQSIDALTTQCYTDILHHLTGVLK